MNYKIIKLSCNLYFTFLIAYIFVSLSARNASLPLETPNSSTAFKDRLSKAPSGILPYL